MQINLSALNRLEQEINTKLKNEIAKNKNLKAGEAAQLCEVSASKISKFSKKLGFENYQQYRNYILTGKIVPRKSNKSQELLRLINYINNFDEKQAKKIAKKIAKAKRIILYGIGPSFIAVQYFAYRLNIYLNLDIITTSEKFIVENNLTKGSLLLIYSATGKFESFEPIIKSSIKAECDHQIIAEEFNDIKEFEDKNVMYLTNTVPSENLLPYHKTRTVFFIFLEEVIRQFTKNIDLQK